MNPDIRLSHTEIIPENSLNTLLKGKKQTIKLHFDMFHGYGKLDKAIDVMNEKDKSEFRDFVNNSTNKVELFSDGSEISESSK